MNLGIKHKFVWQVLNIETSAGTWFGQSYLASGDLFFLNSFCQPLFGEYPPSEERWQQDGGKISIYDHVDLHVNQTKQNTKWRWGPGCHDPTKRQLTSQGGDSRLSWGMSLEPLLLSCNSCTMQCGVSSYVHRVGQRSPFSYSRAFSSSPKKPQTHGHSTSLLPQALCNHHTLSATTKWPVLDFHIGGILQVWPFMTGSFHLA